MHFLFTTYQCFLLPVSRQLSLASLLSLFTIRSVLSLFNLFPTPFLSSSHDLLVTGLQFWFCSSVENMDHEGHLQRLFFIFG